MFELNETEKAKVKGFLADKIMSGAVRTVMTRSFLKPKGDKDIHTLAASRMAIDLLDEAFRELEKVKSESRKLEGKSVNPGL